MVYLLAYNVCSALSWSFLLISTLQHVLAHPHQLTATHAAVGPIVAYVQTTAILEVLHVLLRCVRSPLPTTIIQVSSRLLLVWGITEQFSAVRAPFLSSCHTHTHIPPQAQTNPLYASMILAWSITEVIRYAFYAFSLLGREPPRALTYLRYTTFYALYPLGAGSEAFLILATVPSWVQFKQGAVSIWDVARLVLFLTWWPGKCLRIKKKTLLRLTLAINRIVHHVLPHDSSEAQGIG